MTQAIEGFPQNSAAMPGATGEIGVLAAAFTRMMSEVKDKTASLEKEVAEHRRTEAELERHADRERLFSAAVQSSNDAITTLTLDNIVTGWNSGRGPAVRLEQHGGVRPQHRPDRTQGSARRSARHFRQDPPR